MMFLIFDMFVTADLTDILYIICRYIYDLFIYQIWQAYL
jgi:hypothetical protein